MPSATTTGTLGGAGLGLGAYGLGRLGAGYEATQPFFVNRKLGDLLRHLGVRTDLGQRTLGKMWRAGGTGSTPLDLLGAAVSGGAGAHMGYSLGESIDLMRRLNAQWQQQQQQWQRQRTYRGFGGGGGFGSAFSGGGPDHRAMRQEFFGSQEPLRGDPLRILKKRYRQRSMELHPDRPTGSEEAFKNMQNLYDAFEKNPDLLKRAGAPVYYAAVRAQALRRAAGPR